MLVLDLPLLLDLHASNIREAMGEITSYHKKD
jgi:hypothetical protein